MNSLKLIFLRDDRGDDAAVLFYVKMWSEAWIVYSPYPILSMSEVITLVEYLCLYYTESPEFWTCNIERQLND